LKIGSKYINVPLIGGWYSHILHDQISLNLKTHKSYTNTTIPKFAVSIYLFFYFF